MSDETYLSDRAHRAMENAGFLPDFNEAVHQEIAELLEHPPIEHEPVRDLSALHWSSIDNEESRDLDQLEYAEKRANGEIRLLIAVADVANYVRGQGAIYQHAAHNTTSVYTGVETFHMLPDALSTNKTSLVEDAERRAVVIEMLLGVDATFSKPLVYRAEVKNRARLSYDEAGEFFARGTMSPKLRETNWLPRQLEIQGEAAARLSKLRKSQGALTFSSFEPRPIKKNGKLVDLKVYSRNNARDLIESFMVAANVATATFLKANGWPIIERVVTAPRRWDRICEIAREYGYNLPIDPDQKALSTFLAEERAKGENQFQSLSLSIVKLLGPGEYVVEYPDGIQRSHFGLAVSDYSHSTAPNRRFADLVLQRLIHACAANKGIPYNGGELEAIARRCTERENAARKVERLMRKVCAASLMKDRIGQTFRGMVTGASIKGTYARLHEFPAEGRVVRGERGMDVGDQVRLRLVDVDVENGFIDFAAL